TLWRGLAVHSWNKSRASQPWKIHHVHRVALIHEVVRPAQPSVRRLHEFVFILSHAEADDDNRIRMTNFRGYPGFDIHGAMHRFIARLAHVVASHIEMAFPADTGSGKGWDRRSGGSANRMRLQ